MQPGPLAAQAEAALADIDAIAATVVGRCLEEIPAYGRLPAAVLQGDLVRNVAEVVELALRTLGDGRAVAEHEFAAPVSWGAERARDGIPLDAVLKTYVVGAREVWRIVAERAPGPMPPESFTRVLVFLGEIMPRVAASYLAERHDLDWEGRERRRHLAADLLTGRPPLPSADGVAPALSDRYTVVALHVPASRAPAAGREATTALRQLRSALDAKPEILVHIDGDRLVLLVPTPPADVGDGLRNVLGLLDQATGVACTIGAAPADRHAGIPAALELASSILDIALRLRRPPGLYDLAAVSLELQLAQPGPAQTHLVEVLDPLEAHPYLLETLRCFVAVDHDRRRAAAVLVIHRNTLTYRLGRVHTLTGHNPSRPADVRLLAAALVARDLAPGAEH